ncbi:MAG: B12-binding domain-containing radical SAM protein [Magnetococcales bacterium]|nr:B12-binding domain-containing radical SAM protein [Magnetococcales bacterium]
MGSYLMHHGVDVALCDLTFTEPGRYLDVTLNAIEANRPDVVGFSVRTLEFPVAREIMRAVRRRHPHLFLIAGGPHATFVPEEVAPLVDFGVAGDGEQSCLEIVQALANGQREAIAQIPNLFFQHEEHLIRNPLRPLFDLAQAPLPRYELFDERHYIDHCFLRLVPGARVCGVFEGSRGCPYQCTYCSNATLMELNKSGGKWRREKHPLQLRREIDHFKSAYGLEMIYFVDEVMMTSDARTTDLREHLADLKTRFVFMERPELIRPSRVQDMQAAGAYSCSIGIESGDEEFRRQLLKRQMPDQKILESFRLMQQHGIRTHAFIMMGLPGQTESVMQESIRLLQTIQPSTAQATTFFPLPGTELYELAREQNLLDPDAHPDNYYALSALAYPVAFKQRIKMYADMVNQELWRNTRMRNGTVWLCTRMPFLYPIVSWYMTSPGGYVRYRSIRAMTFRQFCLKVLEKLTGIRISSRQEGQG